MKQPPDERCAGARDSSRTTPPTAPLEERPGGRLRVVDPFPKREWLPWLAALGMVTGLLVAGLTSAIASVRPCFLCILAGLDPGILVIPIVVAPVIIVDLRIARICWRRWAVLAAGSVFFIAYFATFAAVIGSHSVGFAGYEWHIYALNLLGIIALGVIVALSTLLTSEFVRRVRFEIIEQDGTRCWRCGHALRAITGQSPCDVCGWLSNTRYRRQSWAGRAAERSRRWSALICALLLIVVTTFVASSFRSRREPVVRFKGAVHALCPHEVRAAMLMPRAAGPARIALGPGGYEAWGYWGDVPDAPGRTVLTLFEPHPERGQPMVQIRLGSVITTGLGIRLPQDGDPLVICSLDEPMTAALIKRGVPPALLQEMLDQAAVAGWTSMPSGGMRTKPPVVIDGAMYFSSADEPDPDADES